MPDITFGARLALDTMIRLPIMKSIWATISLIFTSILGIVVFVADLGTVLQTWPPIMKEWFDGTSEVTPAPHDPSSPPEPEREIKAFQNQVYSACSTSFSVIEIWQSSADKRAVIKWHGSSNSEITMAVGERTSPTSDETCTLEFIDKRENYREDRRYAIFLEVRT